MIATQASVALLNRLEEHFSIVQSSLKLNMNLRIRHLDHGLEDFT
jgi:hypothetical protein